jgi:hypothetical protein
MNFEPARTFAFFLRFGKPSTGRKQHMTCLDSSEQF